MKEKIMKTKLLLTSIVLLTIIFAGCGKPRVHGKVVFSDDKTPLNVGIVVFEKDGYVARGEINENGNYNIGSEKAGDGLPAGEYKVYIIGTSKRTPPSAGNSLNGQGGGFGTIENLIQDKYGAAATSGLTLKVEKSQTFNIEVERYSPDSAKKK